MYTYPLTIFIRMMSFITSIVMAIMTMFGTVPAPSTDDPISPVDNDNIQAEFTIVSDTHVNDLDARADLYYKNVITDISNAAYKPDAFVSLGDNTESGMNDEWDYFYYYLKEMKPASDYVITSGNHDIRGRLHSQVVKVFTENYNSLTGRNINELFYSVNIKGYTFIVIGSEKESLEKAYLSDKQLKWIDETMAEATKDGKPVFVCCHYPLRNTHGLPQIWNSPYKDSGYIGEQSEALQAILEKYKNVFFLTGHLHTGLGQYTYEEVGSVHSVNCPSTGNKENADGTNSERGVGLVMEVYDDHVLFRARNYVKGCYIDGYDYSVDLEK